MKRYARFVCAAMGLALMAGVSPAGVITFKDGYTNVFTSGAAYTGTKDTWISPAFPNNNYGEHTALHLGDNGKKSLIQFDVSGLAGQYEAVSSVTLRLFVGVSTNLPVNLYRISAANAGWVEGTQSNVISTNGAAWNFASITDGPTTNAWAGSAGLGTADTDYITSSHKQVTGPSANNSWMEFTWSGAEAKSLIDSWTTGPNAGLILSSDATGLFYATSSEYVVGSGDINRNKPELVVEYTVIPEPTTISFFVMSSSFVLLLRRRLFGR